MVRMAVCAGIHLDRAWPELSPGLGRRRRETAIQFVVEIVRSARESSADAIAVLGGICDRRTAMPSTLDMAATAFASFDGPVWIVPGSMDGRAGESPLQFVDWADNTHVLGSVDDQVTARDGTRLVGVPTLAAAGRALREDGQVLLVGGGADLDADVVSRGSAHPGPPVIVGGGDQRIDGDVVIVGQLLPPTGLRAGSALVVDIDPGGVESVERIAPEGVDLAPVSLDVSDITTSKALSQAVRGVAADSSSRGAIRLEGVLQRGVLLPGTLASETDDVGVDAARLDLSVLAYDVSTPPADRPDSRAVFETAVARDDAPDRLRHQAIALGRRALANDE